jgi:tubulin monoglycylase TTLL3/8
MNIIERKTRDINDIIDDCNQNTHQMITEKEWIIISNEEEEHNLENIKKNLHIKKSNSEEKLEEFPENKKSKKSTKIKLEKLKPSFSQISEENYEEFGKKVTEILNRLEEKSPQYHINGSKNIWIVKPVGLSRGRGIQCISSFQEYLGFLKVHGNQYVIQKYIENPLIIFGRKVTLI